MSCFTLVGRFSYRKLVKIPLAHWVDETWKPLLGYSPEIIYLTQGWFGFQFHTSEAASLILASNWLVDGGSIMWKRWRKSFDPKKDYFQWHHLWVLLSGLPLQWRNEKALTEIANGLGHFLAVDEKALQARDKRLCKVLVEVEIHEGFLESVELEWRGMIRSQNLDYLGVSFKCTICRKTGHLRWNCGVLSNA